MVLHKPRFKLAHLFLLVAVLAVELAYLPWWCSGAVGGLTLATFALVSVAGPITGIEWTCIVLAHVTLIELILPAIQASRRIP